MLINIYDMYLNYEKNGFTRVEDIYKEEMIDKIASSIENDEKVQINFDGGFGYTLEFIEYLATLLNNNFGKKNLKKILQIVSKDEPTIECNFWKKIEF